MVAASSNIRASSESAALSKMGLDAAVCSVLLMISKFVLVCAATSLASSLIFLLSSSVAARSRRLSVF